MQWNEIREHYPGRWLLVEAVEAHSAGSQRVLDDIAVVKFFPDWAAAWESYKKLHRKDPQREIYVLHTDRKRLEIGEIRWLGTRPLTPETDPETAPPPASPRTSPDP